VQEDYDVMAGVDFVVNGVSDPVVYSGTGEAPVEISLTFLVFSIDDASSIARRTFAQLSNDRVLDWATHHERYGSITDRGIGYQAYLVTGYELQDDIMRYKQAPYIQCIFNKTERYWRDDTPSD
jgi:hypothetical protein